MTPFELPILAGRNRLSENSIANLRLERRGSHQIHPMPHDVGELSLKTDELKQADRSGELDEEIDIAIHAPPRPAAI